LGETIKKFQKCNIKNARDWRLAGVADFSFLLTAACNDVNSAKKECISGQKRECFSASGCDDQDQAIFFSVVTLR
jgi:hypothetical protein